MEHARCLLLSFLCSLTSPFTMIRIYLYLYIALEFTFTSRVSSDLPPLEWVSNGYLYLFREMNPFSQHLNPIFGCLLRTFQDTVVPASLLIEKLETEQEWVTEEELRQRCEEARLETVGQAARQAYLCSSESSLPFFPFPFLPAIKIHDKTMLSKLIMIPAGL